MRVPIPRLYHCLCPGGNRLVVGRCGRSLLAVERGQSLLVVGPTQSGKTTGIAVPALVEWEEPVVATSVKTDLVDAAMAARQRRGAVLVYDPLRISGHQPARWSPLAESITWAGAKRVAAGSCAAQRESGRSPEDAALLGALAEKLLAPMLLAAAGTRGDDARRRRLGRHRRCGGGAGGVGEPLAPTRLLRGRR